MALNDGNRNGLTFNWLQQNLLPSLNTVIDNSAINQIQTRMTIRALLYFITSSIGLARLIRLKPVLWSLGIFVIPYKLNVGISKRFKDWIIKDYGYVIALATFIVLFVVNLMWSLLIDRCLPDHSIRYYNFLEDIPNIINYVILCPTYVTLGVFFIQKVSTLEEDFSAAIPFKQLEFGASTDKHKALKIMIILSILILCCALSMSFYTYELKKYSRAFWFEEWLSGQHKALNSMGIYYIVTNLFLNILTALVIVAHLKLFTFCSRLGEKLNIIYDKKMASLRNPQVRLSTYETKIINSLTESEKIKSYFLPYVELYTISKVLALVYIANMYTWKAQNPNFIGVLDFTILFLALLAVVLISYPRYHIQFWLYKIWTSNNKSDYPDIRKPISIGVANLCDLIILGAAMSSLVIYVFDKFGLDIKGLF